MWALGIAGFGVIAAVAGHLAALRAGFAPLRGYLASLLTGAAAAGIAWFWIFGAAPGDTPGDTWGTGVAALMLYGAWWFAFLNVAQAMESSIRVQVLREMIASGGRLSQAAMAQRYHDDGLVRLRLERLLAGGAIVERDGCLFLVSRPLHALARFFRFLKLAIIGRPSEFTPVEQGPHFPPGNSRA